MRNKSEIFYLSNDKRFSNKIPLLKQESLKTALKSIKVPYIGHKISNN